MELINNAADARELHWEANKHKEPRPFYHWFAHVQHPSSAESDQQSTMSTVLSTTPQGLVPHTITAPSTVKKRRKTPNTTNHIPFTTGLHVLSIPLQLNLFNNHLRQQYCPQHRKV